MPCESRKETAMNQLVKRAQKHDQAAFCELMRRQEEAMYKVAKAILKSDDDAADAMQDTILACWQKIGTLKNPAYFRTWLTRILINNCNAIWRQRERESPKEPGAEDACEEPGYANAEWELFLDCLDEKYRTVVMLYYVQGFKSREIAAMLGVNENTIRRRLATARSLVENQYHRDRTGFQKEKGVVQNERI